MSTHEHDLPTPRHVPVARRQARDNEHAHGVDLASALGNEGVGKVLSGPGVQRSGATSSQQLDESVARAIEERRGQGAPLPEPVQAEMEDAFGTDLSDVRVHTDRDAHDLNAEVGARAFTAGSDVFFKQGTYDPASSDGRQLLAHELTHVVQQREGTSGLEPGQVSSPSDPAEQHADAVGDAVASGAASATGPTAAGASPSVARQPADEEEEMMQASRDPAVSRQPADEEEEMLQASREAAVVSRQDDMEEEEAQL